MIGDINSRADLLDYLFTMLGTQFRQVYLTDEQANLLIDLSIQTAINKSSIFSEQRYAKLQLRAGVETYKLPKYVNAVTDILSHNNRSDVFSVERSVIESAYNSRTNSFSLLDIEISRQFVQTMNRMLVVKKNYTFNPTSKNLIFTATPVEDEVVIMKIYKNYTEEEELDMENVWEHPFIKMYCEGLCWEKLVDNLTVYNIPLPSGLTLNVAQAQVKADKLKAEAMDDLLNVYQTPASFFVG